MKKLTPLRVYIVVIVLYELLLYVSPLNDKHNWGLAVLIWIPLFTLLPAIIVEVFLTVFKNKLPKIVLILLSIIGVFISIIGTLVYLNWSNNIKTTLYVPDNYDKEYILLVYNKKGAPDITPSFGLQRERKVTIPPSGIFYTSTVYESSDVVSIRNVEIYYRSGKKMKPRIYNVYSKQMDFPINEGMYQGHPYVIISTGTTRFYGGFDCDSLFAAQKIHFK